MRRDRTPPPNAIRDQRTGRREDDPRVVGRQKAVVVRLLARRRGADRRAPAAREPGLCGLIHFCAVRPRSACSWEAMHLYALPALRLSRTVGQDPEVCAPKMPRCLDRTCSISSRPGSDLNSERSGTPGRTRTCDLWVRNLPVVRPPRCVASTASVQRTPPVWFGELRGVPPTNCPRRCSTVYPGCGRAAIPLLRLIQDEPPGCPWFSARRGGPTASSTRQVSRCAPQSHQRERPRPIDSRDRTGRAAACTVTWHRPRRAAG
jgi:hypothetical protein